MNDRIKQLAQQARLGGANFDPETYYVGTEETFCKFAELIVQECADLAYSHSIYSRGVPWNQVIKRHFDIAITNSDLAPYFRTPPLL
jgi:hypothetical protein